ncbi:MAG TPA: hypothetical protein VJR22_06255 [Candidatus Nitrosotalea sp.]|nr:hypothetical protein [Nitrososphaerota archaeon]HKU33430.1 hypothetical protein [Candidatus Nitrosotalea sp.]
MQLSLDSTRVSRIASKFFEQHHSDVVIKDVSLEGNVWNVNVSLGLINKQNKMVKIDANTGMILEYSSSINYEKISDEILAINDDMRYVLITDEKGIGIFSKMKDGKTILFRNRDHITMVSSELRTLRELLKFHNDDLGQARQVNIMRDKVCIFIYFMPGLTVCSSCEYSITYTNALEISEKTRLILGKSLDCR